MSASALAAATNIASLMTRARVTIAPRPRPGKMIALLACPIVYEMPSCKTGSNGLPVAISARPSVHSIRFFRDCFGKRGRIRKRQDDRSRRTLRHLADDFCGKRAGLAGAADQNRRVNAPHDFGKHDSALRIGGPTAHVVRRCAQRALENRECPACPGRANRSDRCTRSCAPLPRSETPCVAIARRIRSAMPIPAVPEPKITMRSSRRRPPVTLSAERIAASTTPAVPWMSSLNVHSCVRY